MILQHGQHYWVTLRWALRGDAQNPVFKEHLKRTIGYYDETNGWLVIGSDELYETYTNDKDMRHLTTYVIPRKNVRQVR